MQIDKSKVNQSVNKIKESKVNVALLDDHPLIGIGTKNVINKFPGFSSVFYSTNPVEFIKWLETSTTKFDIALLDIQIPGFDIADVIKHCKQFHSEVKILMYSAFDDPDELMNLIPLKINGFISKNSNEDDLLHALQEVAKGKLYFNQNISSRLIQKNADSKLEKSLLSSLSKREFEILKLVGEGLRSKEVAEKLHLSIRTIDTHRFNILKKLEVKNMVGALKSLYAYSSAVKNIQ